MHNKNEFKMFVTNKKGVRFEPRFGTMIRKEDGSVTVDIPDEGIFKGQRKDNRYDLTSEDGSKLVFKKIKKYHYAGTYIITNMVEFDIEFFLGEKNES